MKNWITFGSMIGVAFILTLNIAGADQHRQDGRHQHFQRNQNRGQRPPWGRPGYYHSQRQQGRRRAWAQHQYGEPYRNQYGNQYGSPYGYYPHPPVVYAPPPPPPGLNFFFGIGNGPRP